jgi:hypothetical protein
MTGKASFVAFALAMLGAAAGSVAAEDSGLRSGTLDISRPPLNMWLYAWPRESAQVLAKAWWPTSDFSIPLSEVWSIGSPREPWPKPTLPWWRVPPWPKAGSVACAPDDRKCEVEKKMHGYVRDDVLRKKLIPPRF